MIVVLHGKDLEASYNRLLKILQKYPEHHKIKLTHDDNQESFYLATFGKELIDRQKIIICENYLSDNKIKHTILKTTPQDIALIFWEHKQLSAALVKEIQKVATVENFSLSQIFWFLDSISPKSHRSLEHLHSFNLGPDQNLIWQLANRLLLLILAREGASYELASKFTGRNLFNWQWNKITSQSKMFDLATLYAIYKGIVKIDFMLKTGITNLKENTLVSLLIIKYLSI